MPMIRTPAVSRTVFQPTDSGTDAEELANTAKGISPTPSKPLAGEFATGDKVRLRGFKNNTELNGQARNKSQLMITRKASILFAALQ
jgi:hypothetical protein